MPDEIFLTTLQACGAVIAVSLTAAVVKGVFSYLSGKIFAPKTHIIMSPIMTGSTTGATNANILWSQQTEPAPVQAVAPPPPPPPPPARPRAETESVFPPLGQKPKMPDDFVLECGNCKKQIKSEPTSVKSIGGKSELRYRCEHCAAQVAVKI